MTTATTKRPKKLKILERHVQEGITALLELDGWRALRTDPVSDRYRGKGFGEPGMPDHLYLRYGASPFGPMQNGEATDLTRPLAEVLWIEYKRLGKTPADHQLLWHAAERARGALVLVVDDFDKFRQFYCDSGLNRRISPVKSKTA